MILFFLILAQIPSFTLQDVNKNEVVLDSLLVKGPVVIDFWATWCKPCMKSLDFFKKLGEEFDSVTFIGINEDGPRSRKKVPLIIKSHKWDFLILYDNNKKAMKLLQVQAIPHLFVIGKGREILYQHMGFKKKHEKILFEKLKSLFEPEASEESEASKESKISEESESKSK